jgi:cysteine desulfurase/selenocysteine lyase
MNKFEMTIDEDIIEDFPILNTKQNGKPLVYLDSAATSQKPKQVINAVSEYYENYNANIHRGIYKISEKATEAYKESKENAAKFINGGDYRNIVYVRNATEAINLVSLSWGEANIKKGDHILISMMEHHSNMIPWQMLAKKKEAVLDYIKLNNTNSFLDMDDFKDKLNNNPKIVAITHVSNVLGTINDVKDITKKAHKAGAKVLIDGAQSVPHMKVDVNKIGCDFLAFSSHKMLGPSGIGCLWASEDMLDSMQPVYGGGEMIKNVSFESCTLNELPWKFEAGTQNIEGAIGFGAAIKYINNFGIGQIEEYEKGITEYALKRMDELENVEIYGPENRTGIISFSIKGIHAHDIAQVFDSENIAIRSGHHCAMPLVKQLLKENSLARISFYLYNKLEDVDAAIDAIEKTKKLFAKKY